VLILDTALCILCSIVEESGERAWACAWSAVRERAFEALIGNLARTFVFNQSGLCAV